MNKLENYIMYFFSSTTFVCYFSLDVGHLMFSIQNYFSILSQKTTHKHFCPYFVITLRNWLQLIETTPSWWYRKEKQKNNLRSSFFFVLFFVNILCYYLLVQYLHKLYKDAFFFVFCVVQTWSSTACCATKAHARRLTTKLDDGLETCALVCAKFAYAWTSYFEFTRTFHVWVRNPASGVLRPQRNPAIVV